MFEFRTMTVGVSFDLSELEVREGVEEFFSVLKMKRMRIRSVLGQREL